MDSVASDLEEDSVDIKLIKPASARNSIQTVDTFKHRANELKMLKIQSINSFIAEDSKYKATKPKESHREDLNIYFCEEASDVVAKEILER